MDYIYGTNDMMDLLYINNIIYNMMGLMILYNTMSYNKVKYNKIKYIVI